MSSSKPSVDSAYQNFDAARYLHEVTDGALNEEVVRQRFKNESGEEIRRSPILPGVEDILAEAKRPAHETSRGFEFQNMPGWIHISPAWAYSAIRYRHLLRGCAGRPHQAASGFVSESLGRTQSEGREALIFEDSPHGVAAANAAGIAVVVAPNPTTIRMPFNGE